MVMQGPGKVVAFTSSSLRRRYPLRVSAVKTVKLEVQIGTWSTVVEDAQSREKGKILAIKKYREEKDSKIPTSILIPYVYTHRIDDREEVQEYLEKLEQVYAEKSKG